jgi:uncharacterized membrane protein (UPF0127 family)
MAQVGRGQAEIKRADVVLPDGTVIRADVADTEAKRERGLMFRRHVASDEGMLFVFEIPGKYPFWMQNCVVALDIIWIDSKTRIVHIAEAVPPCRLSGCEPPCASVDCPQYDHAGAALYTLELAEGMARRHRLKVGDKLSIRGLKGVRE